MNDVTYIETVWVTDPDTGGRVSIEVYKDNQSAGIFAIDSSYLEQVNNTIPSPFSDEDEPRYLNLDDQTLSEPPSM